MIEPVGQDSPISIYDRYSQYQQYRNPAAPSGGGNVWDAGPSQNKAVPQGQDPSPGKAAPLPGQALPQGQAVPQNQGAQGSEVFRNDTSRKSGAVRNILATGKKECQTCKNRRYQDQSNDSGVSYQTPTKISPDRAAAAVRSHEQEHVTREQAKANREGREVVSQSVVIKTAICPECGRVYISGGTTTTVTRAKGDDKFQAGQPAEAGGRFIDQNI